jgi:DNA polymerase-2
VSSIRKATCEGWLLDLYADLSDGAVLWLIQANDGDATPPPRQGDGLRLRLHQAFPVTFYAAGPNPRLHALWRWLEGQTRPVRLAAVERRDLFQPAPLRLLSVEVANPVDQERLFAQVTQLFPDLTYYDADIPIALRHAALFNTFPLARLQATFDETGQIHAIQALDTPWDLDPEPPILRILSIEPDCDPNRSPPTSLYLRCERRSYRLSLAPARPLLVNLAAILRQCDPDLIQSAWGDTWLLPYLLELSAKLGLPLPLNRDTERETLRKRANSYFSYGQVIHRGQQVHLFGRWHIDIYNAMMFHDYGLEGILESARVTSSPVQDVARRSPGSGISAMQMITALRSQVLVPWHKQQVEDPKSTLELIHADQGGLVYRPITGLHSDVAEIDFISMYPGIMVRFNISPETVGAGGGVARRLELAARVPTLDLWVEQETPGLIPRTLQPLLEKRIALKQRLALLPAWDPRRRIYKGRASAHKWLLVTCFGYLGYKNARFGRIEAHESVTAYSREALLRAKEAAEDLGFRVLHMYVDGLWVQKPGCRQVADIQPLLDEIVERTHLPIALEGIYRWVAFLPSRLNPRVPVANRYFGVFQDGSIKVRGIEARRGDTPPFIAQAQMHMLGLLGIAANADELHALLPRVIAFLHHQCSLLRQGRLLLEKLVITQKLSRELELYRAPSPAARAARQLEKLGKTMSPGQHVRFIYTLGDPGVHAWDLPEPLDPRRVDRTRYRTLLVRAAASVLGPLGIDEEKLALYLDSGEYIPVTAYPESLLVAPQNPVPPVRNRRDGPGPASNHRMDS